MTRFVPYLAEETIERDSTVLLAEFEHARGVTAVPPIPIEDIVEKHLKLGIEFDDLHQKLGVPKLNETGDGPDILGAMFFDEARIVIDEHLDPDENPEREGRYRFTLAHEGGGHWRLHRHLFARSSKQGSLFEQSDEPAIVCRSSDAKERVELQADFYASCLLMPRRLVLDAWKNRFGDLNARRLKKASADQFEQLDPSVLREFEAASRPFDDQELENFARPFAEKFKVSKQAMRIRLEKLGLLSRGFPQSQRRMNV